jgi:hypothetical protein
MLALYNSAQSGRTSKEPSMPEATVRTSRWGGLRTPDTPGAIYGTIAAMAVIAGTAHEPGHGKVLGLTVATLFVFWLAHVYALALAHHLEGARRLDWAVVREAMAEEWPLLAGPAPLLAILALERVGLLEARLAVRLALWLGVAQLVGWGIAYARRQRWRWLTALTAGWSTGCSGSRS